MSAIPDQVTKYYGKQKALDAISFMLREGEIIKKSFVSLSHLRLIHPGWQPPTIALSSN